MNQTVTDKFHRNFHSQMFRIKGLVGEWASGVRPKRPCLASLRVSSSSGSISCPISVAPTIWWRSCRMTGSSLVSCLIVFHFMAWIESYYFHKHHHHPQTFFVCHFTALFPAEFIRIPASWITCSWRVHVLLEFLLFPRTILLQRCSLRFLLSNWREKSGMGHLLGITVGSVWDSPLLPAPTTHLQLSYIWSHRDSTDQSVELALVLESSTWFWKNWNWALEHSCCFQEWWSNLQLLSPEGSACYVLPVWGRQ